MLLGQVFVATFLERPSKRQCRRRKAVIRGDQEHRTSTQPGRKCGEIPFGAILPYFFGKAPSGVQPLGGAIPSAASREASAETTCASVMPGCAAKL